MRSAVTIDEAAVRLGVTREQVEGWIELGELPIRPLGIDHVRKLNLADVERLAGRLPVSRP
jgi:excisionase family DNA binding protein